LLLGLAGLGIAFGCSKSSSSGGAAPVAAQTWTHPQGTLSIDVNTTPFGLVVHDAKGNVLMESTTAHSDAADASDPIDSYAPLSFTHNEDETIEVPMKGWDYYKGEDGPWQQARSPCTSPARMVTR
jgi:hypothetical protein